MILISVILSQYTRVTDDRRHTMTIAERSSKSDYFPQMVRQIGSVYTVTAMSSINYCYWRMSAKQWLGTKAICHSVFVLMHVNKGETECVDRISDKQDHHYSRVQRIRLHHCYRHLAPCTTSEQLGNYSHELIYFKSAAYVNPIYYSSILITRVCLLRLSM